MMTDQFGGSSSNSRRSSSSRRRRSSSSSSSIPAPSTHLFQVELHQGEVAAMKVDAKDAKRKQLQEWGERARGGVEDE